MLARGNARAGHPRAELEAELLEVAESGGRGAVIRDLQRPRPLMLPATSERKSLRLSTFRPEVADVARPAALLPFPPVVVGSKMFRVALSSKIVPTIVPGVAGCTRGETEHSDRVAAGKAKAGVRMAEGIDLVYTSVIVAPLGATKTIFRFWTVCWSVRASVTVMLSIAPGLGTLTLSLNVEKPGVTMVVVGSARGWNTLMVPRVSSLLVTTMSSQGQRRELLVRNPRAIAVGNVSRRPNPRPDPGARPQEDTGDVLKDGNHAFVGFGCGRGCLVHHGEVLESDVVTLGAQNARCQALGRAVDGADRFGAGLKLIVLPPTTELFLSHSIVSGAVSVSQVGQVAA